MDHDRHQVARGGRGRDRGLLEARAELKILVEAVADIRSLMAVMAEVGGLVEAVGKGFRMTEFCCSGIVSLSSSCRYNP